MSLLHIIQPAASSLFRSMVNFPVKGYFRRSFILKTIDHTGGVRAPSRASGFYSVSSYSGRSRRQGYKAEESQAGTFKRGRCNKIKS